MKTTGPKLSQPSVSEPSSRAHPEPQTTFFKSKLFVTLLSVGFAVAALGGGAFYFSRDSAPSSISHLQHPPKSQSRDSVKVSAEKGFANQAAVFLKEPTAVNFKMAVSQFHSWHYFTHTVVLFSVALLLVVGLAVGLSLIGAKRNETMVANHGNEKGNEATSDSGPKVSEENWFKKNVAFVSVLCVLLVGGTLGGIFAFVQRKAIKRACCESSQENSISGTSSSNNSNPRNTIMTSDSSVQKNIGSNSADILDRSLDELNSSYVVGSTLKEIPSNAAADDDILNSALQALYSYDVNSNN
jgi:hypothetical protein